MQHATRIFISWDLRGLIFSFGWLYGTGKEMLGFFHLPLVSILGLRQGFFFLKGHRGSSG